MVVVVVVVVVLVLVLALKVGKKIIGLREGGRMAKEAVPLLPLLSLISLELMVTLNDHLCKYIFKKLPNGLK